MSKRLTIKNHSEETFLFTRRVIIAGCVIIVLVLALLSRLIYLQLIRHDVYSTLSNDNRVNVVPIAPTRGLITDRHGELLAENVPVYSLEITPERVKNLPDTLTRLRRIVHIDDDDLAYFYKLKKRNRRFKSIPIRLHLSEQEVARFAVERHAFPGVRTQARLIRHYPYGSITAHVLGYVGRINEKELKRIDPANYSATQFIGKIGIEKYYEKQLHGVVGHQQIETNAQGRVVRVLDAVTPTPGATLHLTIDVRLQAAAQKALGALRGSVVAIEPATGDVLALVSNPSYDPNLFVNGIAHRTFKRLQHSPDQPLFNRAIRGQYPPASIVKPMMGLIGLDTRTITAKETIADPGWYKLKNDDHLYRDWKRRGHGIVDLYTAIVQSCDTYFFGLAHKLQIKTMHDYLLRLGYGQRTNIDLAEELPGLVPSPAWKKRVRGKPWYPGETLIAGIGQGFMLATPLQLAHVASILATRGHAYRPHLLKASQLARQKRVPYANQALDVIRLNNPNIWHIIIQAMRGVVRNPRGTAYRISSRLPYTVAGKTGTAQVFSVKQNERYVHHAVHERLRDHYLFIAFAPIMQPKIAIAVVIENHSGASELARKMLDLYLKEDTHGSL